MGILHLISYVMSSSGMYSGSSYTVDAIHRGWIRVRIRVSFGFIVRIRVSIIVRTASDL